MILHAGGKGLPELSARSDQRWRAQRSGSARQCNLSLAEGLARLGKFDFPFTLSPTTRAYYQRLARIETGQVATDMQAILRDPPDQQAMERLYTRNPEYNSAVRTTCVATMVDAGHAANALPQRARVVLNCRVLPSESVDAVRATLVRVLADERIKILPLGEAELSPAPPLTPAIVDAVERTTNEIWPGVPVVPALFVASNDGRLLNNASIWIYGASGMFVGVEGSGAHGLNEHIRVKSLYDGYEFLYRVGKRLALD